MKCHYIYVPNVGKVLIPGCIGTAAMGIENCTCRDQKTDTQFEREQYDETVRELRSLVKDLENENAYLNRIIRKLITSKK